MLNETFGGGSFEKWQFRVELVGEDGKHLWELEGAEVAVGKRSRQSCQQRSCSGW